MKKLTLRYRYFLILVAVVAAICVVNPPVGQKTMGITWGNTVEMLTVIPPVFILLGLLEVWVKRDTMIRLMGEKSGLLGILTAFLLGSVAAGPLYAAFPVAGVLIKKGCKFSNILVFIGAWSTTKIPMLVFEASSMGWKFMITRFVIDLFGILAIAYGMEMLLSQKDRQRIQEIAGMK